MLFSIARALKAQGKNCQIDTVNVIAWIVLHVEGGPYERGYQHGRLLAPEIAAHVRCFAASVRSSTMSSGLIR